MNKSLLIVGSNSFFSKAILNHIFKNKKNYINKINNIILFSRKKNQNLIVEKLKKYFQITFLSGNILKIKSIPYAKYIIYCLLLKDFEKDLEATKYFIKLVKNQKKKSSIIYTSSGAVYGPNHSKNSKIKENLNLNSKNYLNYDSYKKKYALYKLKNEKLFKRLPNSKFKIVVLRCFAFVGKDLPSKKNFVIKDLIDNIIENKKVIVKSNYQIIRSYLHQEDLAKWLLKILFNIRKSYGIYNFGSDNTISIHKLAIYLAKKNNLKYKSSITNLKYLDNYVPNIKKLKKEFGLKLKFKSIEAISATIKEIKKLK